MEFKRLARSCTSIGILVSSTVMLCVVSQSDRTKNWSLGCTLGIKYFSSVVWILPSNGFDANMHYIWPARMSRSIRSALYVPGSSLKSSLNMEYALTSPGCRLPRLSKMIENPVPSINIGPRSHRCAIGAKINHKVIITHIFRLKEKSPIRMISGSFNLLRRK
jgi:hypothetical protein